MLLAKHSITKILLTFYCLSVTCSNEIQHLEVQLYIKEKLCCIWNRLPLFEHSPCETNSWISIQEISVFFGFRTFCIISPAAKNWIVTLARVIPFQASHTFLIIPTSILSPYTRIGVHSFQSWVNTKYIFHLQLILFDIIYDVISTVLLLLNPTYTKILPSLPQSHTHALKPTSHA